jgi:putative zinc finger protein
VKKANERDESIDSLLKSHLPIRSTQPGHGPCVEPDVIAAWSDGNLAAEEAALIEAHLASCASCQQTLAVFARTEPASVSAPSLWQRWRLQWVVPIAAAATAVAIYVSLPDDRGTVPQPEATVAIGPQVVPGAPAAPSAIPEAAPPPQQKPLAGQDVKSVRPPRALEKETRREADNVAPVPAPQATLSDADAAPRPAPATLAPEAPQAKSRADAAARQEAFQSATTPTEIVSPDPLVRWRVLPTGRLERSTNAGRTWEMVTVPEAVNVVAIRAISTTAAILTTADGRQFRTDDGGKTWTTISNN